MPRRLQLEAGLALALLRRRLVGVLPQHLPLERQLRVELQRLVLHGRWAELLGLALLGSFLRT